MLVSEEVPVTLNEMTTSSMIGMQVKRNNQNNEKTSFDCERNVHTGILKTD